MSAMIWRHCLRYLSLLASAGVLALLAGCERPPANINLSRPPQASPDAVVRFSGDLTGTPDVALSPRASRKFVSITNAEPEVLVIPRGALYPVPYARFTVAGNDYDWFGEYVGVEKRQGPDAKRLVWRHPAFERMFKRLEAARFHYSEALFHQALADFEAEDQRPTPVPPQPAAQQPGTAAPQKT
jgi:hypothetical protein